MERLRRCLPERFYASTLARIHAHICGLPRRTGGAAVRKSVDPTRVWELLAEDETAGYRKNESGAILCLKWMMGPANILGSSAGRFRPLAEGGSLT